MDLTGGAGARIDVPRSGPTPAAAERVAARPRVTGTVLRVNGPIVELEGLGGVSLADLVESAPATSRVRSLRSASGP